MICDNTTVVHTITRMDLKQKTADMYGRVKATITRNKLSPLLLLLLLNSEFQIKKSDGDVKNQIDSIRE